MSRPATFRTARCGRDANRPDINMGKIRKPSVATAMRDGIGFVPEDRRESGFAPELSVEENATITVLNRICSRVGLIVTRSTA
jgi:simple sugar transport system ATP-binding protein